MSIKSIERRLCSSFYDMAWLNLSAGIENLPEEAGQGGLRALKERERQTFLTAAKTLVEALADGAVACGLPRDKALLYAKQTVLGAASLALTSGKHPEELKDAVCSPGGTTIEGVLALENGSFRGLSAAAVKAAFEKTLKMGK